MDTVKETLTEAITVIEGASQALALLSERGESCSALTALFGDVLHDCACDLSGALDEIYAFEQA